jgi:hypothetical protein
MTRQGVTMPVRVIAGLLPGLLLAIVAILLTAQPAYSATQRPLALGYDKAHEVTINGTISEVIAKPAAGGPTGLHVMVTGAQGKVDAHLGPYMTKEVQEALHAGTPVQIVGAMEKLHGKEYLLARQVIFGGRLVQVRSENGLLIRVQKTAESHHGIHKSGIAANGGAR